MKQLHIDEFGKPSVVLRLAEADEPTPLVGQLQVAMEAAPVNPSDLLLIQGVYGVRPKLPACVGAEGVGKVIAVGEGVPPDRIGQRVLLLPTQRHATWAEVTTVDQDDAIAVDGAADPLQLAMTGVNPVTAHVLLTAYEQLEAGQWVAHNAANSATGGYIGDLARKAGLNLINIVRRDEAAQALRAQGVSNVVVSGPDLVERAREILDGEELSLLLEAVGGSQSGELVPLLRAGASVVAYSSMTGQAYSMPFQQIIFRGINLRGFWLQRWLDSTPSPDVKRTYQYLAGLIAQGTLSAPVEAAIPLEDYADAIARASQFQRAGKIVLTF